MASNYEIYSIPEQRLIRSFEFSSKVGKTHFYSLRKAGPYVLMGGSQSNGLVIMKGEELILRIFNLANPVFTIATHYNKTEGSLRFIIANKKAIYEFELEEGEFDLLDEEVEKVEEVTKEDPKEETDQNQVN